MKKFKFKKLFLFVICLISIMCSSVLFSPTKTKAAFENVGYTQLITTSGAIYYRFDVSSGSIPDQIYAFAMHEFVHFNGVNFNNQLVFFTNARYNINPNSLPPEDLIDLAVQAISLLGLPNNNIEFIIYNGYFEYRCYKVNNLRTHNMVDVTEDDFNDIQELSHSTAWAGIMAPYVSIVNPTANVSASYTQGFQDGQLAGQSQASTMSYSQGWSEGYQRGLADAEHGGNTLTDVVATFFDMPVRLFQNIFNFEILGVNLSAFMLSMLSLFLGIVIIKRFI